MCGRAVREHHQRPYSRTLCQTMEPGKRCTAHSDPASVRPRAGSLRSTSLPHRGYVGGPAGPACTVCGCLVALPSPSRWLLWAIWLGYAIQFARHPPKFSGIHLTSVKAADAHVLCGEIAVLLAKDMIELVPPANMKTGFYRPYFIVPKKGGGLRPILDLHILNQALHKLPSSSSSSRFIFHIHDYTESINQQWGQVRSMDSAIL